MPESVIVGLAFVLQLGQRDFELEATYGAVGVSSDDPFA